MNARDEPRERLCVMYPVVVIIVLVVLEDEDDKEDSSSMVCKYCVTSCNGTWMEMDAPAKSLSVSVFIIEECK